MKKLIILFYLFAISIIYIESRLQDTNKDNSDGKVAGIWTIIHGKEYYFSNDRYYGTWSAANNACRDMNMTLVNIETQEENDAIFNFISTHLDEVIDTWRWTSGKRLANTTEWKWTGTGSEYPEFNNWTYYLGEGDQPNLNITIEACCEFAVFLNGWIDDECEGWRMSFVCEENSE